jgi:GT2 family glycosyltransferase
MITSLGERRTMAWDNRIGVVVIGRNEGARLRRCLDGLVQQQLPFAYADSASSDDSVAQAKLRGGSVVALDNSKPMSAARGRNEGFAALHMAMPELKYVMFLDGDCELDSHFLGKAQQVLDGDDQVAAVVGTLRERAPEASVYNRICDFEWNGPPGDSLYFGGIVLQRVSSFVATGGYDATLIAGEDPDLACRVRLLGSRIVRIAAPMALHDVDMHQFSQWWKRARRTGFAYEDGAHRRGGAPLFHWQREVRSNWLWGAVLPLAGIVLSIWTGGLSLVVVVVLYVVLFAKITRYARGTGLAGKHALEYGFFSTITKVPFAIGQAQSWLDRRRRTKTTLIEYK